MMIRQKQWAARGFQHHFINLGADASLQGGRDWFIVQEDTFDVSAPGEFFTYFQDRFGQATQMDFVPSGDRLHVNDLVQRRLMPMLILGSGMSAVPNKLHLLLHAIKLEVSLLLLLMLMLMLLVVRLLLLLLPRLLLCGCCCCCCCPAAVAAATAAATAAAAAMLLLMLLLLLLLLLLLMLLLLHLPLLLLRSAPTREPLRIAKCWEMG